MRRLLVTSTTLCASVDMVLTLGDQAIVQKIKLNEKRLFVYKGVIYSLTSVALV